MEEQQKAEIGRRIKELRNNSPETNRSIAEASDVSVEAVGHWIAGMGIAHHNVVKVAELFGKDVNYILCGAGAPDA